LSQRHPVTIGRRADCEMKEKRTRGRELSYAAPIAPRSSYLAGPGLRVGSLPFFYQRPLARRQDPEPRPRIQSTPLRKQTPARREELQLHLQTAASIPNPAPPGVNSLPEAAELCVRPRCGLVQCTLGSVLRYSSDLSPLISTTFGMSFSFAAHIPIHSFIPQSR
jgi:hypothetical protein